MDLKDYSHWVEMELLHFQASAAFLHSHNQEKIRESHGLRQIKNNFLFHAQIVVFWRLVATQTKAMLTPSAPDKTWNMAFGQKHRLHQISEKEYI